jgi:hypothetical protein
MNLLTGMNLLTDAINKQLVLKQASDSFQEAGNALINLINDRVKIYQEKSKDLKLPELYTIDHSRIERVSLKNNKAYLDPKVSICFEYINHRHTDYDDYSYPIWFAGNEESFNVGLQDYIAFVKAQQEENIQRDKRAKDDAERKLYEQLKEKFA